MSLNPDQVPLAFFKALQSHNYPQAWTCLTHRSRETIVDLLAKSWKAHSAQELTRMFEHGHSVAEIYWQQFTRNLKIQTWLDQSYQQLGQSGSEVLVKASPSGVHLMVFQEAGGWKLGYIETFMDFR